MQEGFPTQATAVSAKRTQSCERVACP